MSCNELGEVYKDFDGVGCGLFEDIFEAFVWNELRRARKINISRSMVGPVAGLKMHSALIRFSQVNVIPFLSVRNECLKEAQSCTITITSWANLYWNNETLT
jgi:hypothetical protein